MEDRLRAYMDSIFRDVMPTKQSVELKEEILQNLTDKYRDLISEGKNAESAYNIAVASIGDTEELLGGLKRIDCSQMQPSKAELEQHKRKSALLVSIAVALYILSIIPPILLPWMGAAAFGPVLMFVMIALATGILIYNYMTRPQYQRSNETIVEEFREWQSQTDGKHQALKAIKGALWSLTVVIYILLSFSTMSWHITWVIFLIAAAVEGIIKAVFEWKGM